MLLKYHIFILYNNNKAINPLQILSGYIALLLLLFQFFQRNPIMSIMNK